MKSRRWLVAATAVALAVAGCDDRKASVGPVAVPVASTAPAATPRPAQAVAVAVKPPAKPAAAPTPVSSFRIFDENNPDDVGVLTEFPRARLHLNLTDNVAVLYSDDPRSAIKPGYTGNSYYLEIPLDKDEPLKLDGYRWQFKAPSLGEHQDSADGIFLNGQRIHLQPTDVTIAFQGQGREMKVAVLGHFARFDTLSDRAASLGTPVYLKGIVDAKVDAEK